MSKSIIIYIVGPPAAGKTTLVRSFMNMKNNVLIQKPKITLSHVNPLARKDEDIVHICAAGHYCGNKHDGADTIPISQIHKTISYMVKKDFFNAEYVLRLFRHINGNAY